MRGGQRIVDMTLRSAMLPSMSQDVRAANGLMRRSFPLAACPRFHNMACLERPGPTVFLIRHGQGHR